MARVNLSVMQRNGRSHKPLVNGPFYELEATRHPEWKQSAGPNLPSCCSIMHYPNAGTQSGACQSSFQNERSLYSALATGLKHVCYHYTDKCHDTMHRAYRPADGHDSVKYSRAVSCVAAFGWLKIFTLLLTWFLLVKSFSFIYYHSWNFFYILLIYFRL